MLLMAMPLSLTAPKCLSSRSSAFAQARRYNPIYYRIRIYNCALMPAAMRSNSSGSNCRCGLVKRMSASLCMGTK